MRLIWATTAPGPGRWGTIIANGTIICTSPPGPGRGEAGGGRPTGDGDGEEALTRKTGERMRMRVMGGLSE